MAQRATSPALRVRGATSTGYGRIHNADVLNALVSRFGDGTGNKGDFKVPGEFGKDVPITEANTTLFLSDRDMFVFLCDEVNRIEMPNRRDGKSGSLARGFFVSNSEVGVATLSVTFFLFDYVCCNRIVWGATDVKEISMRHSSKAPERFADEIAPVLNAYSKSSAIQSLEQLRSAQFALIGDDTESRLEWLSSKFGNMTLAKKINQAHIEDEQRPVESIWDAVTGATAFARSIPFQNERVALEKTAGRLLDLVAA